MSLLVIAAHVDPREAAPLFRAALSPDVELCAFVEQGLSSKYHELAQRLRRSGRLLPALLTHAGAKKPVEGYDRIVFVSWSAPYALAEELLIHPADAAALAGWVALDSGYGEPTPGVCDLARRARAGTALYWAGYTDVPTSGYKSSGQFLDVVKQKAGDEGGLFHVVHWAHDAAVLAAAQDKAKFWREEHIGALHKGPAFLAEALAALPGGARTSPLKTDEEPAPSITLEQEDPAQVDDTGAPTSTVTQGPTTLQGIGVARSARNQAVTELARAALKAGVHEHPPGSNEGPEIAAYLGGCVRNGRPLGLAKGEWCAAFAAACVFQATYGGEARARALTWTAPAFKPGGGTPPVGWRAAVHELVSDARATGAWHDAPDDDGPSPGDLIVMKRSNQDPRNAGFGHVAVVDEVADGGIYHSIGGNESNVVKRTPRGGGVAADQSEEPIGWIKISS